MAKYKIFIYGMLMLALACSCEKVEIRQKWEDRYVNQKVDTTQVIDRYFLDSCLVRKASDLGTGKVLEAVNLFLDAEELYVANFGGRSVEVFDAGTLAYKRSIAKDERSEARDVYVQGDYLFVAAGNRNEVQIFEKNTGKYLTRLGTGNWWDNISFAGNVAATEQYVFVRDSKATNIRVIDRAAISMGAASNNNVFASLSTESYFIDALAKEQSHDMEIIGDSLYAFLHAPGIIYAYSIPEIARKKNNTPFNKTQFGAGTKVYSIASNPQEGTLFVAMDYQGRKAIMEISVPDFQKRDFSHPKRMFESSPRHPFPTWPMIAYHNGKLIFTNGPQLVRWTIRNNPSYVIKPHGQ